MLSCPCAKRNPYAHIGGTSALNLSALSEIDFSDLTDPEVLLPTLQLVEKKLTQFLNSLTPAQKDKLVDTLLKLVKNGLLAAEKFVSTSPAIDAKTKKQFLGLINMFKRLPDDPKIRQAVTVWMFTNYIPNLKKKCLAAQKAVYHLPKGLAGEPLDWEKLLVAIRRANGSYFCNRGSCKKCGAKPCKDAVLKKACHQEVAIAADSDTAKCYAYKNVDLVVGLDGDTQWVAIAGTNDADDVLQDVTVLRYWDQDLGIAVHMGMYNYFQNVMTVLLEHAKLDKKKPIDVVGHSLGGASAALVALKLKRLGYKVPSCITFGAPAFAEKRCSPIWDEEVPLVRVVNDGDAVTATNPMGRYRQVGPEVRLYGPINDVSKTTYAFMTPDEARENALDKDADELADQGLAQHNPDLYLARISHIVKNGAKKYVPPVVEGAEDDDAGEEDE